MHVHGGSHGEQEHALHDLRAFRRVSVGADKLKLSFDIPVESLQLMQPSGEMGLTAGKWTV